MIIELSDFFNNPSLIELGPLKIQYYAVTWLISAVLIYIFLKNNNVIKEIGLNEDAVNDMVFLYGLFCVGICLLLLPPSNYSRNKKPQKD